MSTIKSSFCHFCLAECGIKVELDDQKIISIKPNFDDPVSRGYVCEKSQRIPKYLSSPDRLLSPLKKVNDKFVEISWDQALEEISQKLRPLTYKPKGILYMAPLSPTFFFNTIYNLRLMKQMGVNYVTDIFSVEKLDHILAQTDVFGSSLVPDRENAETLLVIGKNSWITHNHPRARAVINAVSSDPNRCLIVVDPVDTPTAAKADIHVKLQPGTDLWFLLALLGTVAQQIPDADNRLIDINIEEYLNYCGIDHSVVEQIAKRILTTATSVDVENGIDHMPYGFENHWLISVLLTVTGNINVPGGMSLNKRFPTYNVFTEQSTPATGHPQPVGSIPASLLADNLTFDAVIIDNNNPVDRYPNKKQLLDKMKNLDLVVALDSFRTATTDIADYILPTPTFHERQEIVGLVNYNLGILQQSRPLVEPPAEVRSSSSIYKELLARLGHDVKDCEPSIESVGDQLRQYYLRNLNDIKQAVTLANNHVEQLQSQGYTKYQTFSHTVSKLNLEKLQYMVGLKPMARTEKYPYILSCGSRTKESLNNILSNTSSILEISTQDAVKLKVNDGDRVQLSTDVHQEIIKVKIAQALPEGYLRLPNSKNLNQFTGNMGQTNPWYKFVYADIKVVESY